MHSSSEGDYKNIPDEEEAKIEDSSHPSNNGSEKYEVKSNIWIYIGLLAGVLFSLSNFLYGKYAHQGMKTRLILGIGNTIGVLIFLIFKMARNKYNGDAKLLNLEYFTESNGSLKIPLLLAIVGDVIISTIGVMIIVYAFQYSLYADLNQGILTTMFSFGPIFISLFAYFIFQEEISGFHLLGMIFLIFCAVLLAFSGDKNFLPFVIVEGEIMLKMPKIIPIILGILCPVYFMIRTLTLKLYHRRFNIPVTEFIAFSHIISGVIFIFIAFAVFIPSGISGYFLVNCILGGILQVFGTFCVYYAATIGYAGPASAIASIQMIIQTVMDITILGQTVMTIETIALILGIIGAIIISAGGNIAKWMKITFSREGII